MFQSMKLKSIFGEKKKKFKYNLINISLVGKKKKSDSMKFKGKKEYEYSRMFVIHIFPVKTANKKTFIHAEKTQSLQ